MICFNFQDQESDWTIDAINGYKFKNDTFENLCEHNARLALNSNKISVKITFYLKNHDFYNLPLTQQARYTFNKIR